MKNWKLLLDLDGTIISNDYKISPKFKKFIMESKDNNNVLIVTGRSVSDAYRYYQELKLNGFIICYNGAYAYNPVSGEEVFCNYLYEGSEILRFIKCKYDNVIENIVISQKMNTYFLNYKNDYLFDMMTNTSLPILNYNMKQLCNIENLHRIVLSVESIDKQMIIDDLKNNFQDIEVYGWKGRNDIIDISIRNTDKWKTAERVFNKIDGKKDKIIAIGDAINDISMIRNADIGIAMINAPNIVKKNADYITDYDNDEDGAYLMLKRLDEALII